ncbi:MAG: hypothetical protein KAT28_05380 [Candidatus Aenigmarchaeota archaeon]|nr:hypothetical protein [Candidatus Aenigmarchaeota archaeon]
MSIDALVDKYFEQIAIEVTAYVPVDDAVSDAAHITLNLPLAMLREYSKLKGLDEELPDGAKFWKEINIIKRLRDSGKFIYHEYQLLRDILDFLGDDVEVTYQKYDSEKIRLDITEIPEFLPDTPDYKQKVSRNYDLFADY